MKEVNSVETQQVQSTVFVREAAEQKHQAEQTPQIRRGVMPPPTPQEREERHSVRRQQRIKEELAQTQGQSAGREKEQQSAQQKYDEGLVNDILGEDNDPEKINTRNEQLYAQKERKRLEEEKLREEAKKASEDHKAYFAAMTPEEREQWEKRRERIALKPLTPEEWQQLMGKMLKGRLAAQREKATWLHERDPRYDPMTGDLLEPDELPLDQAASYVFEGTTRPRRFMPPESPHMKDAKPLQNEGDEKEPESPYHERLVKRLLKAGFVEVEPTLADKASFEKTQWYRSLSPFEQMQYLQEAMQEMIHSQASKKAVDKETPGEKFAKFIDLLVDLLIALIKPDVELEKNNERSAHKTA